MRFQHWGGGRQEDQKFKIILPCIENSTPAWATGDTNWRGLREIPEMAKIHHQLFQKVDSHPQVIPNMLEIKGKEKKSLSTSRIEIVDTGCQKL